MVWVTGFDSHSSLAVATYSVSLTAMFPLTSGICRRSTYCISSLQWPRFSLVISVMNRIVTPLLLKSIYPFLISSTPIEKDGDKESPHTSALFLTLDMLRTSPSMAFSSPYHISVFSLDCCCCATGVVVEFSFKSGDESDEFDDEAVL